MKIIDNVFKKNDEGGLFPLRAKEKDKVLMDWPEIVSE